jgi:SulP family sulfate permease
MLAGSVLAALLNQAVRRAAHRHRQHRRAADRPAAAVGARLSRRQRSEKLVPIAMAVAVLALTEAVSISRAVALKSGQRIDGNQEFIGQGLSNLAAPSSPAMPPAARSTAAG